MMNGMMDAVLLFKSLDIVPERRLLVLCGQDMYKQQKKQNKFCLFHFDFCPKNSPSETFEFYNLFLTSMTYLTSMTFVRSEIPFSLIASIAK